MAGVHHGDKASIDVTLHDDHRLCCARQMGTHGIRIVSNTQSHLGHDVAGTLLRGERISISNLCLTHEEYRDAIRAIHRRN
jgi:hypothetical protein